MVQYSESCVSAVQSVPLPTPRSSYSLAPLILSDKEFHIANGIHSDMATMRRQGHRAAGLVCMSSRIIRVAHRRS